MIYCIWYPSGGFGHFVNAAISLYGRGFKKPKKNLIFSSSGESHSLDLIAPKICPGTTKYKFSFDPKYNYTVLVDKGINNESTEFKNNFEHPEIIKICYSDVSWPIIARTLVEKAMQTNFDSVAKKNLSHWNSKEDWAVRENYFLYLRDQDLRFRWRTDADHYCILVEEIIDYQKLATKLKTFGLDIDDFSSIHQQFINSNKSFIDPVVESLRVVDAIKSNCETDLSYFKNNIWAQSIVYYYIQTNFNVEVRHNDYAHWFTSIEDIVTMLNQYGVKFDSN